jgi:diacylglycerol O-acyltransferase / trehalose O-mycolyltransferase
MFAPGALHAEPSALPPDCPATPCLIEREVPRLPSPDLGAVDTRVRVILPAAYDGHRRLPVVYLLHGAGDAYRTWVDNTDVETFAGRHGAIIVMPDGGGSSEAGWYSDWDDGSRKWETFHIRVLVPWVDATFATLASRSHRAVMGLSMGGFGSVQYAARHPRVFGAAASFSGLLDTQMTGPVEGLAFGLLHPYVGTPDERVWGSPLTNRGRWRAHNPAALARSGALRHLGGNLWLTTGTGTPGGPAGDDPSNPGGYAIEQFIWETNLTFQVALIRSGTRYHDLSYLGGPHDWAHWQYALHLVLPKVVAAID